MNNAMQDAIRKLDESLISRHRHDSELFERLEGLQRASGIMHGDRPICPFLRPYFISRSLYSEIRTAARVINMAFDRLAEAALEEPFLAERLGLTEPEMLWARMDPGYAGTSLNSRLDTFISSSGFAFLEYNAENPAGIGDQSSLHALFRQIPELTKFLDENEHHLPQPMERLLYVLNEAYAESGGKNAKPSIAIVDWKGVDTSAEFDILLGYFEKNGHKTIICDPHQLEYTDQKLRCGDFVVDIFYKRVLIHEFHETFDHSHPLFLAGTDGAVCLANSFRSKVSHKKSGFSILTDPQFFRLFTTEQLDAALAHLPWTRIVEDCATDRFGMDVELLEFIRTNRERLVLKPNDDYGGHGIHVGWERTASQWDEAIEVALAAKYVVQERVDVEKTRIPTVRNGEAVMEELNVDFDPFLFRGHVEGGMVRLSASSLVNITQGGGETALAVLEGF